MNRRGLVFPLLSLAMLLAGCGLLGGEPDCSLKPVAALVPPAGAAGRGQLSGGCIPQVQANGIVYTALGTFDLSQEAAAALQPGGMFEMSNVGSFGPEYWVHPEVNEREMVLTSNHDAWDLLVSKPGRMPAAACDLLAAGVERPPESPGRTPSAECINPPQDVADLFYQTDPLACYGTASLTIDGVVSGPGLVDCPVGLEPSWFACDHHVLVSPIDDHASARIVLAARSPAGEILWYAALHPDLGRTNADFLGDALRLTGHYDDPAALTCHYSPPLQDEDPAETVWTCRVTFVITAIAQIPT